MSIWRRKPWLTRVGREGWGGLLLALTFLFVLGGTLSLLSLLFWSEERAGSAFQTTLVSMVLVAGVRGFAIWTSRRDNRKSSPGA
jgi:hypothetical protein